MKVYLLSRPEILHSVWDEFVRDEDLPPGQGYVVEPDSDAERLCEIAGRLCYMSYGKGRKSNAEFLDNIITSGHHSVLEHANFTVLLTGISRSCTHELIRHRHFSYSQLSQRYVDESSAVFICPSAIQDGTPEWEAWAYAVEGARRAYGNIVSILKNSEALTTTERKAIRTAARCVLPNATETKIVVTGNARAWRDFFNKRITTFADPEIKALAAEIHRQLSTAAPNLFTNLEVE